jgi:hypothetical protein
LIVNVVTYAAATSGGLAHDSGREKAVRYDVLRGAWLELLAARDELLDSALQVLGALRNLGVGVARVPQANAALASDTAGSPYCQTDEDFWLASEGTTSERQFGNKLLHLAGVVQRSYEQNDLDGMCDAVRRLLWVRDLIEGEPFVSVYTSGLVLSLLHVGHACADGYLLDEGYTIVRRCIELLGAKRRYRETFSMSPRADSECWYRVYELLAELKWKGGEEHLNDVMLTDQLFAEYESVERRCLDYMRQNPSSDPTRDRRVKEALGWCRLQMIKMGLRWFPDGVPEMIDRFNKIHGTRFTAEAGDFLAGRTADSKNPWFWDLELFKWCLRGPATPDEAFMCHQWRLDAMRAKRLDRYGLEAYEVATLRELQNLLDLGGRVEVADAC